MAAMQNKPRGFTCYLCGGQFGSTSLKIHVAACQKKWEAIEATKPPKERRPLPPPPTGLDLTALPSSAAEVDKLNAALFEHYDKISLVGCPICARTFNPEAFAKHQKVCTPDKPGGPLGPGRNAPPAAAAAAKPSPVSTSSAGSSKASPAPSPGAKTPTAGGKPAVPAAKSAASTPAAKSAGGTAASPKPAAGGGGSSGGGGGGFNKPRAYMCYLCGCQYGSTSLAIHVPQCMEKWIKAESVKPAKDRRAPPPPPEELDSPLPTAPAEIDAFNERMSGIYNGSSLMPCRNCGRTFRPEALAKHQNACTADNPMNRAVGGGQGLGGGGGGGRVAAMGMPDEQAGDDEELEECPNCHRRMRSDVMLKHGKICTPNKPMKSVKH